jgi:hypothetical protein
MESREEFMLTSLKISVKKGASRITREVCPCIFPEPLHCHGIVGAGSIGFISISANMEGFFVNGYFDIPLFANFMPIDALISRRASCDIAVHVILLVVAGSEIKPLIIKTVSVSMICHDASAWVQNFTVHLHSYFLAHDRNLSPGVKFALFILGRIPLPLIQPFVISIINKGYLASRKRNLFHERPPFVFTGDASSQHVTWPPVLLEIFSAFWARTGFPFAALHTVVRAILLATAKPFGV